MINQSINQSINGMLRPADAIGRVYIIFQSLVMRFQYSLYGQSWIPWDKKNMIAMYLAFGKKDSATKVSWVWGWPLKRSEWSSWQLPDTNHKRCILYILLADVSCFPIKIHPKKHDVIVHHLGGEITELNRPNCHEPSLGELTALRTVVPRADLGAGGAVVVNSQNPDFVVGNFMGMKSLKIILFFFWQIKIMWCVGMWACMLIYGDCWWFCHGDKTGETQCG